MQINIKATKAQLTPQAHDIINEKIESLAKYCDCIIKADVEVGLTSLHHNKGDIYRAEVNLEVPGKVLRAEAETENITKSMNEVRDKLKMELVKYKEKIREK
ncbi:MAG: ribosome-associated translation inhibitor RaiA [Patescibacteria group bacterium]